MWLPPVPRDSEHSGGGEIDDRRAGATQRELTGVEDDRTARPKIVKVVDPDAARLPAQVGALLK